MTRILRERDRLLAVSARATGVAAAVTAVLCLSLPGALPLDRYLVAVPLLAVAAAGMALLTRVTPVPIALAAIALGVAAIAVIALPSGEANPAVVSAVAVIGAGLCPSAGMVLLGAPLRWLSFGGAALVSISACALALIPTERSGWELGITAAGWAAAAAAGIGLHGLVPHTLDRIATMTKAYRTERQASEREARRRQNARLLHDTVLATLTLLAHSGVGVREAALRQQAAEDAALLRQLRLGFDPKPMASGDYKLRPVEESALGNTLESVKHRFSRMGLEVKWHGSGQVLLPSEVLDAFLLALSECLENVRRHAGVDEANVTITDDDMTVRAMVTDAGVGFDLGEVDPMRLGFAESIVARLHDVGGKARLFSSPGSGTTVVLEVPK